MANPSRVDNPDFRCEHDIAEQRAKHTIRPPARPTEAVMEMAASEVNNPPRSSEKTRG